LIYTIINEFANCISDGKICEEVSKSINTLKLQLGNYIFENTKSCLDISPDGDGFEILDDIMSKIGDNSTYSNSIQNIYKYKYCLEKNQTVATTDDINYIDTNVNEKESLFILLYKQLYYELLAFTNFTTNENYEYAKDQIITIIDTLLSKQNNQGLFDIYKELDNLEDSEILKYTNVLQSIKNNLNSGNTLRNNIPVYSIRFGDADLFELNEIANFTNAKVFDGTNELLSAFKEVRGYN
jgi:hypothetical protein